MSLPLHNLRRPFEYYERDGTKTDGTVRTGIQVGLVTSFYHLSVYFPCYALQVRYIDLYRPTPRQELSSTYGFTTDLSAHS
jgi:hypothetical protein